MKAWRCGCLVLSLWLLLCTLTVHSYSDKRRLDNREQVRSLFYHGYHGYMRHAFPMDELMPLSCKGRGSDRLDRNNFAINDVCGDFSLTLVDLLDTLAILGDREEFRRAVRMVVENVSFDVDSKVQVFEANMYDEMLRRSLLIDPSMGMTIQDYHGELLDLARSLADRLLPAFDTPTGIPYARVNLRHGVLRGETTETCSAGAGSLVLEFATLTHLTNEPKYYAAAKAAFDAVWARRSSIGLIGNTLDVLKGLWTSAVTGIGAGVDSFWEYSFKAYVLLGDNYYLSVWETGLAGIRKHVQHDGGYFYRNVNFLTGFGAVQWIDSLSSYFPGLLALTGDIESAVRSHLSFQSLWSRYGAILERFNILTREIEYQGYPLRPEFIESTYFLYRATRDEFYLSMGEQILDSLKEHTMTECGFASLASVETKEKEDRMESFILSESLKYLYLLFDEDHTLNKMDKNLIFTTEAHPLYINRSSVPDGVVNDRQCAVPNIKHEFVFSSIMSRGDISLVQHFVGVEGDLPTGHEHGTFPLAYPTAQCSAPVQTDLEEIEITFASPKVTSAGAALEQIVETGRGKLVVNNLDGVKFRLARSSRDSEFSVTYVDRFKVKEDEVVIIVDPNYRIYLESGIIDFDDATYHLYTVDALDQKTPIDLSIQYPTLDPRPDLMHLNSLLGSEDPYGCTGEVPMVNKSAAILMKRGECSFTEKVTMWRDAGVIIVIDDQASSMETHPLVEMSTLGPDPAPLFYVGSPGSTELANWNGLDVKIQRIPKPFGKMSFKEQGLRNVLVKTPHVVR